MRNSATILLDRIRERMKTLGLQDGELAKRIGWSRQQMSQYLNGRKVPSIKNIDRIAKALETTAAQLLDDGGLSDQASLPPKMLAQLRKANSKQLSLIQGMLDAFEDSVEEPKRPTTKP